MRSGPKRTAQMASLCAVLALSACNDRVTPVSPDSERNTAAESATQRVPRPQEEKFVELASKIPGFGGFFIDSEGNLVAHLTDLRHEAATKAALAPLLRDLRGAGQRQFAGEPQVLVRSARYDFAQLAAWRDLMIFPVLEIPGVTLTDLDEQSNRLAVGIENEAVRPAVERKLAELGIPLEAVLFKIRTPFHPDVRYTVANAAFSSSVCDGTSLDRCVRPLVGGFRMTHLSSRGTLLGECTLGFTALWGVDRKRVFVTNAHCSASEWGGADATRYYQPGRSTEMSDTGFVGTEVHDPQGSLCYFFGVLFFCRYSDANIVQVPGGIALGLGEIARTQYAAGGREGVGSTIINPDAPRFIVEQAVGIYQGLGVNKVGRQTGWTYGAVVETCADVRHGHTKLCQGTATYGSARGDSGSPVFRRNEFSGVSLVGLHWGTNQAETLAVFSTISGIERDLGPLTVTYTRIYY